MRRSVLIIFASALILGVAALLCANGAIVHAQQTNAANFNQTFEAAVAKARGECAALWSDHAFDPLRSKIPFGDEKPSFQMLTNTERLHPKDKPLADLAIKTLEKCRAAFAPVYAMLPPQVNGMILAVQRRQDSLIAELYRGKITFGEFDTTMNKMSGELVAALSGIPTSSQSAPVATQPPEKATTAQLKIPPPRPQPEQHLKSSVALSNETRLALVIGNSNYVNLPKLSNPVSDARAIGEILKKLGYKTRLLLDASEQNIRREVRQFASDTDKADVAFVFFAGHGAQVNGNNYLLPIDIDIPRTAVDIQFTGLKVDDLVNSIRSNTKIVFLDACRDNPALFKNIVTGRGSSPVGLAPAAASNFDQKPGGGVFIAYATDAGSVADDGKGEHSPFTQALLRNIQKPISIDDMFSLVTREVRLVTKNAQRPYKYASLENIICVTPACSNSPAPTTSDVVQQAIQSESDELQIALQTNNLAALETYLQKYPETPKRAEIQHLMGNLRRAEFTEWTLYEVGNQHNPWYLQISSIQQFGDRVTAKIKSKIEPTSEKIFFGKPFPDADYSEDINVFDCTKPVSAISEETIFSKTNDVLYHYKFGDPRYINLSNAQTLSAGSVGHSGWRIMCHEDIRTPTVSREQLSKMNFKSLSSTVAGDGDIFYEPLQNSTNIPNQKEFLFIMRFFEDHKIPLAENVSIQETPVYRTEVDKARLLCAEKKTVASKYEYYDASNKLVYFSAVDQLIPQTGWIEIKEGISPLSTLHRIFCGEEFAGIGVQIAIEDSAVKVAEVIENTPAAKAGIKANDIITHLDNQPLGGFALEQVIQKMRGLANTKIILKILRKGQDNPIELSVTREIIQIKSTQERVLK